MTLYTDLLAAGVPVDHHESDLYAKQTPDSARLADAYRREGRTVETFQSAIDRKPWYCFPFAYDPFWERLQPRANPELAPTDD